MSQSTLVSPPPAAEELHYFLHLLPSTGTEETTGQDVLAGRSESQTDPHKHALQELRTRRIHKGLLGKRVTAKDVQTKSSSL